MLNNGTCNSCEHQANIIVHRQNILKAFYELIHSENTMARTCVPSPLTVFFSDEEGAWTLSRIKIKACQIAYKHLFGANTLPTQ